MINVAIFVSGNGTNCESLIRHFSGSDKVKISVVLSNKADAYALVRAQNHGIPTVVMPKKDFNDESKLMPLMNSESNSLYSQDFCSSYQIFLSMPMTTG